MIDFYTFVLKARARMPDKAPHSAAVAVMLQLEEEAPELVSIFQEAASKVQTADDLRLFMEQIHQVFKS